MALKVRLKVGERMILNGAVIRNSSGRSTELEILNSATFLHERDLILPEHISHPLEDVYLHIQLMHIEPEHHDAHYKAFMRSSSQFYIMAMNAGDEDNCTLVNELVLKVAEKDYIGALKRLQQVIGKPGDARSRSTENMD